MNEGGIVQVWLRSLGLVHYTQAFLDNGYDDLDVCRQIGTPDLDAIGVLDPVDRQEILTAVSTLGGRTDLVSSTPVYFMLENPDYGLGAAGRNDIAASRWSDEVFSADICAESDVNSLPRAELMSLIQERLVDDAVKLMEQPYFNEGGELNRKALMQLASRYAGALNTRIADVIDCLQELVSTSATSPTLPQEAAEADIASGQAYKMVSVCGQTMQRLANQTLYCGAEAVESITPVSADQPSPSRSCRSAADASPVPGDVADGSASYEQIRKGSFGSSLGRFLKSVTLRRSTARKYAYQKHEGDLSASEITMTEEDRIQLMLLVKEGKISVQEAIETVKKYRKLALDDETDHCEETSTLQRENVPTVYSPLSSPSHQTFRAKPSSADNMPPPALPKERSKSLFSSPFFGRKVHKATKDSRQPSLCILHRCRAENISRTPRKAWSPPPLPPLPTCSGTIVESVSAEFTCRCRSDRHSPSRAANAAKLPTASAIPSISMVRKSQSLHSSAAALHQISAMLDLEGHFSNAAEIDSDASNARSPKRHTPPTGSTPESQLPKRQFVSRSPPMQAKVVSENPVDCYPVDDESIICPNGAVFGSSVSVHLDSSLVTSNGLDNAYDDEPKTEKLRTRETSSVSNIKMVHCHHDKLTDIDRTHSSMDSLTNIAGGTCGISSSSSHSSMSIDDESISSKFISRVRAYNDSTLATADDQEALNFKKGDIIYLLAMSDSGIWRGIFNSRIGTFRSSDVETILEDGTLLPTPRTRRPSKGRRGLRRPKPKTVEELLSRLGLQSLVGTFIASGFTTLEEFSELDEVDLDELHVTQAEDRAKLLTAAQLLVDYENTGSDVSHDIISRSSSQSPARSHDASCQTLSFIDEHSTTANRHSTRHVSDTSSDDQELTSFMHDNIRSRSDEWLLLQAAGSQTLGPLVSCKIPERDRSEINNQNSGNGSKQASQQLKSNGSEQNGIGSLLSLSQCSPLNAGRTGSPSIKMAQVRQLSTGPSAALPWSGGWKHRTATAGQMPGLSSLTKQHGQLVSTMCRLLENDSIDLSTYPYTHQITGESGVPTSLIRHYAEVLHCGRSEAVLAMEECRQRALALTASASRREHRVSDQGSVAMALPVDGSSGSIAEFLTALGLSVYAGNFAGQRLTNVTQLYSLTVPDLVALGVTATDHIQRLLGAIDAISSMSESGRPTNSSDVAASHHSETFHSSKAALAGSAGKTSSISWIVDKV